MKLILFVLFLNIIPAFSQEKNYDIYIEYEKKDEIKIKNDSLNIIHFKYRIKNLQNINFDFFKDTKKNNKLLIQNIDENSFSLIYNDGKTGKNNTEISTVNKIKVPDLYYYNFESLNYLLKEADNIFLIDLKNCENGECDFYE